MSARRVVVHGRVQGVGFRASMATRARDLGVVGWVRNRPGGTVEAHVEGDAEDVEALLAWTAQGPPSAQVERVDTHEVAPAGATTFDITA